MNFLSEYLDQAFACKISLCWLNPAYFGEQLYFKSFRSAIERPNRYTESLQPNNLILKFGGFLWYILIRNPVKHVVKNKGYLVYHFELLVLEQFGCKINKFCGAFVFLRFRQIQQRLTPNFDNFGSFLLSTFTHCVNLNYSN